MDVVCLFGDLGVCWPRCLSCPAAGLVELVNRCLSFSACDRPEFREVLTLLEGEYRALRARQPPRSQREHQQPSLPQHQQVHAGKCMQVLSHAMP